MISVIPVLPQLKNTENVIDKANVGGDFIPEELLFALTQRPQTPEHLGPPGRRQTSALVSEISDKNLWCLIIHFHLNR